jgi:nucleoside-triphosphatase THEP1
MSALAAIVFDRDDEPDMLVRAFVASMRESGAEVGGLLQEFAAGATDEQNDALVRDLETGELLPIMQDLGALSEGCRIDPAAMAVAATMLARARNAKPDLLVVNRFGRLESEGGGLIQEIGAAVAQGTPLLICVPRRFLDAWNAFAAGLDVQLTPTRDAIEDWWTSVASAVRA